MIWERLIKLEKEIIEVLDKHLTEYKEPGMDRFNKPGWTNRTWSNMSIRRAHVDVVDARETKGLWMAHICLFPMKKNGLQCFLLRRIPMEANSNLKGVQ